MINRDYLYTDFCDVNSHCLEANSLFIYEQDTEDRSVYCKSAFKVNNPSVEFIGVEEREDDMIDIIKDGVKVDTLNMHSALTILTFIRMKNPSCVYLDVTGMNCRVAAPLLKVLLEKRGWYMQNLQSTLLMLSKKKDCLMSIRKQLMACYRYQVS